jgi:hypothetical protein
MASQVRLQENDTPVRVAIEHFLHLFDSVELLSATVPPLR